MKDVRIVELYWARDAGAIDATSEKYGAYCAAVAGHILSSPEDVEECVNDTYLAAWNAIPPARPERLAVFLGKLTRNLAFNRWKRSRAGKRGGREIALVLDELTEVVSDRDDVEGTVDRRELMGAIDAFLASRPERARRMFVRRYWYAESAAEIAKRFSTTEGAVMTALSRERAKLRAYLRKRGFEL